MERRNFYQEFGTRKNKTHLFARIDPDTGRVQFRNRNNEVICEVSPDDLFDADGNRFDYADNSVTY